MTREQLLIENENMIELLEALESATNVRSATYDNETQMWTITYKNGLTPDVVPSDLLIEFLHNA